MDQYKYLVWAPGNCASVRLALQLASDAAVLKVTALPLVINAVWSLCVQNIQSWWRKEYLFLLLALLVSYLWHSETGTACRVIQWSQSAQSQTTP